MKKAMSLVAVAALAVLAIAWVPRQTATAEVDQAQLDAQIDARLHALLGKMIEQTKRDAPAGETLAAR